MPRVLQHACVPRAPALLHGRAEAGTWCEAHSMQRRHGANPPQDVQRESGCMRSAQAAHAERLTRGVWRCSAWHASIA
jgi:hypothetical protein